MQDNNDKLIQDFLQAGKQSIEDRGFSNRVMQQLPATESWLAKCWTWGCLALTAGLFIRLNGFELLYDALRNSISSFIQQEAISQPDTHSLLVAGAVLLCLLYKKIASMA